MESVAQVNAAEAGVAGGSPAGGLRPGEMYFNRDLSWLDFNRRVLHEAMDPRTPLLERVKFLAIFASNQDEFFMKRVGLLQMKIAAAGEGGGRGRSLDGLSLEEQWEAVRTRLGVMAEEQKELWLGQLKPALERERIFIRSYGELTVEQKAKADEYFQKQIFPVLTPLAVDPGHPFPFISNLSLSIGVLLRQPQKRDLLFARVKVPQLLSRWLPFLGAEESVFVPLEDLIQGRLEVLFPGMEVAEHKPFRVTRNAEVETEIEDPEDLLEVVQEELRARRFADTVRVQIPSAMSAEMRRYLIEGVGISVQNLYEVPEPLGLVDLMGIANLERADLHAKGCKMAAWQAMSNPVLADADANIFSIIKHGDVLVHHPYEPFDSSVERFILSAVKDPKVLAIKMTLYRTSGDSPFVPALAMAAEAGKQVAVLVELKARFDEERNIQWAQALENAGAHVIYGVLGLKTHTKTALVVRREDDGLRCYAHLATGNYNSKTAQLYTDLGLLTCREDICEDIVDLFAFLTGRSLKTAYRKLLVAPATMRPRFLEMIEREIGNVRAGRRGHIVGKMNALEDEEVIQRLYRASRAGVKIDLIVRGFCCLRPGVAGLSENIRVISVIGRFLEHSRMFYFLNDAAEGVRHEYYLSSADWMERNLSHRIEAAVPVEDETLRQDLQQIIDIMLEDNRQAWELGSDGTWTQRRPKQGEAELGTHARLMELTTGRAKAAALARLAKPALI